MSRGTGARARAKAKAKVVHAVRQRMPSVSIRMATNGGLLGLASPTSQGSRVGGVTSPTSGAVMSPGPASAARSPGVCVMCRCVCDVCDVSVCGGGRGGREHPCT